MPDAPAPTPGGSPFAAGQVVTVFRSRRRAGSADEYAATAVEMFRLARTMPGLVDVKSFASDDGEHVTIATFADEESQRAWHEHAEHRAAQRAGRNRFYAEYSLQVCDTVRVRRFQAGERVQR
jgi:heme-degrading monooxygenase HmoA